MEPAARRVAVAALAYFGTVFGVGFVLGVVRVTAVVPLIGMRWAELGELPLMVMASFLAARHFVGRFRIERGVHAVAMGLLALALMLGAELGVVLLQGHGIAEYIASRDPLSGSAYLLSLLLFGGLPALLARRVAARR